MYHYHYFSSAILLFSIAQITLQVGFSIDDMKVKKTSPERNQKHELYSNNYQSAQLFCAQDILDDHNATDSVTDFIILSDESLKSNYTNDTKCFFGCVCQQLGVLYDNKKLNSTAVFALLDAAADDDNEVKNITDTCGGLVEKYKNGDYCEACFEIYRCLEQFDDDED